VHDRNRLPLREPLDRPHVPLTDLAQQRRRRNRKTAVQKEADEQALAHQPRYTGLQEQSVNRAHLERDTLAQ
jgi:hypothetical protein